MPDNPPLGPTGQPIQPNPFQQGQSSNLNINTTQAQKAMEDFHRTLDNLIKSFGGSWEKITNDRLATEERFYRAIGDKAKARQKELERYSKEAIANIDAETKAKIDAYALETQAGKHTQEELLRHTTELNKKASTERVRIESEAQRSLAREHGLGGIIRGKAASISESIGGGAIGGLVTNIASLATNPWALLAGALEEMAGAAAEFRKTGAELAGAGLKLGAGAGAGLGFATSLFGGPVSLLSQALSREQQRALIATMSGSRTMIDQARATGGFEAIRGNLGLFANILPDASKEMELFTDATKSLGMSQQDITNTFVSSRVNAERLKITQLDAIKTQMEMQKVLRNITNDGTVAATVLTNVSGYLKSIGASEIERQRIALAVTQAGATLPLPSIVGMFGFTHGGKLPTPKDLFGETGKGGILGSGGVFNLLGSFMQQVSRQAPANSLQRLLVENQLIQQYIPGLRLQDLPKAFKLFEGMARPEANLEQFQRQFKVLEGKTPQVAMAEGISTLANIVDPIRRLENVFTNFWTMLDDRINKLLEAFHNPFRFRTSPPTGWMTRKDIEKFRRPENH